MTRGLFTPSTLVLAISTLAAAMAADRAQAADGPGAAPPPAAAASAPVSGRQPAADDTQVQQVVVTGNAQAGGLRKLEAGYSITTADEQQIKEVAPSSTADLLKIVPGIAVEATGGQSGPNIRVRGFPEDGDSPYATMQLNGVPLYPTPTLSFMDNSSLFRIDDTVQRVEVLRGGPSPIFGNGQPGVTVNFIQKKGDDVPEGGLRLTLGTGDERRIDGYYGGPLAKDWYVHVGGFWRTDNGVRDTQYPADSGGQGSLMVTHRLDGGGELDLWTRQLDDRNAFYTGVPLVSSDNGRKISGYPGFDPRYGSFLGDELRHINFEVSPSAPGGQPGTLDRDLAQGRGPRVSLEGASLEKDIAGWHLDTRSAFMTGDVPTYALFSGPTPQTLGSFIDAQVAAANGDPAVLAAAGGVAATGGSAHYVDGSGAITDLSMPVIQMGMWTVDKHVRSFSNETRVSHDVGHGHTVTLGTYFADYSSHDLWYLNNTVLLPVAVHARPIDVALDNGVLASRNGYVAPAWTYDVNADYSGRNAAAYVADAWRVTPALRIDAGLRIENERVDGTLENSTTGDLDANPLTLYDNNISYFTGSSTALHFSQTKPSWTLGANYNFSHSLSVFVRANQGQHFPGFDDLRNGAHGVEHIAQYEAGVKTATKDYTAFVTLFTNRLTNSQYQTFTDTGNQVQHGGSKATGLEFETALRPVRGLELTLDGDWQDAKYTDAGDITGNTVVRQPKLQTRFTPSWTLPTDWASVRVYGTWTHVGDRYSDTANQQILPHYDTLDLGASAEFESGVDLRLSVTNVTNTLAITEGNPRVTGSGVNGSGVFIARPLFGRAYEVSVGYSF